MEQKEFKIKEMSEVELKALIYDQMGVRENATQVVKVLKEELDRREREKITPTPVDGGGEKNEDKK